MTEEEREDLINELTDKLIATIHADLMSGDHWLLNCILRGEGFIPFNALTDAQLLQEKAFQKEQEKE